jgi:hypothetical protein
MKLLKWSTICLVATLAGCCCPMKKLSPAERAEKAAAAASEKAASKAADAELAKTRKRCTERYGSSYWEYTCEQLVLARLLSPASADFSSTSVSRTDDSQKCVQFYASNVNSKNAFGVVLETRFRCAYNTRTDMVTVEYLGEK